jgi:hypothetical protein
MKSTIWVDWTADHFLTEPINERPVIGKLGFDF